MRTHRKRVPLLFAMLAIAMIFILTGKEAEAATKYRQIAYVNTEEKRLVLKFKEFCTTGYIWEVKEDGKTLVKNGQTKSNGKDKSRFFKINLGSLYKPNTKYVLTVTGKDKKKTLTVRYYTADIMESVITNKTSKDALQSNIMLSSAFEGTRGELLVFKGEDSTDLITSAKMVQNTEETKKIEYLASIAGSKLANGEYKTYTLLTYTFSKKDYYGPGIGKSYNFIKTQYPVTDLKASTYASRVKLTWSATKNADYYKVYQSTSESSGYKCIASKVKTNAYTTAEITGGKTYYYKIESVGAAGSKTVVSDKSAATSIKVPIVPYQVKGVKFAYNMSEKLVLRWSGSQNTTGYYVWYKESTASTYKKLTTTSKQMYDIDKLNKNKTYNFKIQSYRKTGDTVIDCDVCSKVMTINPKSYEKKYRALLLANGVKTMTYSGSKCIYSSKKNYSTETKKAFVNAKGYSSPTKYLIWISHYTQQVIIYKGSKGKWKIDRVCETATGKAESKSPHGVFKVTYKETGWFYTYTKELYVTHWKSRNSFHTRPLYNDGSVCTATIGRPASHGCARLYNKDALYIYKNMPRGTTVVSY